MVKDINMENSIKLLKRKKYEALGMKRRRSGISLW